MWSSGLRLCPQDVSKKNERSALNEVHLVVMRLLSVFMSRTKSGSKSSICEVSCFGLMGVGKGKRIVWLALGQWAEASVRARPLSLESSNILSCHCSGAEHLPFSGSLPSSDLFQQSLHWGRLKRLEVPLLKSRRLFCKAQSG